VKALDHLSFSLRKIGSHAESAPMDVNFAYLDARNFTFAPFSMTRPDLSETRVSGTLLRSVR